MDLVWENNAPMSVTIKSKLGGNCRIRSYFQLQGEGLKEASGANENPFYQLHETTGPIISEKAELGKIELRKVYEYDVMMEKGEGIELSLN